MCPGVLFILLRQSGLEYAQIVISRRIVWFRYCKIVFHMCFFSSSNAHVQCDTGYPHNGRADNAAYRHDRRADKRRYPHDREIDIQMLKLFRNGYILSC